MNTLRKIVFNIPRIVVFHTNSVVSYRYCSKTAEANSEAPKVFSPPPFLKLPAKIPVRKDQKYDYFLVLDFEATCDSPVTVVPQEIIEFPVLKVSGKTFEIESIFHSYVRPVVNPQLTKFCTQLTGITQEIVDSHPPFEDVFEVIKKSTLSKNDIERKIILTGGIYIDLNRKCLGTEGKECLKQYFSIQRGMKQKMVKQFLDNYDMQFHRWLEAENLLNNGINFACATCGDWDLKYILPMQCKFFRIPVPDYLKRWINVKVSFAEMAQLYPRNMVTMMKYCQLQHEGRLHSGLDDCKNIAKILKDLADRGMVYECNGQTVR